MIRYSDISIAYRSAAGSATALCRVTLEVEQGERVVVLGANGSGKSTLARLANGLLLPDTGSVEVDGLDTRRANDAIAIRSRVGMVFQQPDEQIVATSVEEDVAFGPENLGLDRAEIRSRVDAALAATGLSGLEHKEPHVLSGGQKQRLAVAGALAMKPAYLVLDEPASMLDPAGRAAVLKIADDARAAGVGVLHVTHDVAEAAGADRIVVLARGRVQFSGTVIGLLDRVSQFSEWGLELPVSAQVAAALRERGAQVAAAAVTAQELEAALWP